MNKFVKTVKMKQNQCLDFVKQTKSSNTKPDFDSSKDGHSGKT